MGNVQKTIPTTSVDRYISGRYALNIPSDTSGDWHFTTVWFSDTPTTIDLWGVEQKIDTTKFFGDFGIEDRVANVDKTGLQHDSKQVYVADHIRAILDMAISGAIVDSMSLVRGATMDYLDTQEQKELVLEYAKKAMNSYSLSHKQRHNLNIWIIRESKNIYRGESY